MAMTTPYGVPSAVPYVLPVSRHRLWVNPLLNISIRLLLQQQLPLLWVLLAALPATRAALTPPNGYDDDNTPLQLSLEDLEREQEQHFDLNRPPLLPTHYEWHPSIAASVPPSYVHDAAQLEQAERLRQLHQQHQQLSAGYALPGQLPDGLLLLHDGNLSPTPSSTPTTATTQTRTRLLQPIVPFDLDLQLQLNGVQYLSGNALSGGAAQLPRPIPRPVVRPLRPPYAFLQQQPPSLRPGLSPHPSPATLPLLLQQSKQFAYAPMPQRNYAPASRIPLPYPPSFVSITTRSPASGRSASHSKPFRPSQPDLTPDLFAGRDSKSLLDSYIPSWEVLRLYQQQQSSRPFQRHTLAYAVPSLRVFKRDSKLERSSERSRIVKKSLDKQLKLR
ncbi:carbohydrate-responsive element-binding protein [Drosophila novamexicana]|uniref:carbohydrate-responsive element-binding protein n=1 Tax=Drosophila novamexicana TaxID=47314 RepID=UPI0011E5DAB2|nr:carbohydrate-responsive element-binding protein [Drosophila novamexicana]